MRVVILGGGIAGLIAAHSFVARGVRPTLIEANELGGQFATLRAVKFLRFVPGRERSIAVLLSALGCDFDYHPVRGGVLIDMIGDKNPRVVIPHPECLGWPEIGHEIQRQHWLKTRFQGRVDPKSMNNDSIPHSYAVMKIVTDIADFIRRLTAEVREGANVVEKAPVSAVSGLSVTHRGNRTPYDYLVSTTPLWTLRAIYQGDGSVPFPIARRLMVRTYEAPLFTECVGKDYLYTPMTPFGAVHRVSSDALGDLVTVEANRRHDAPAKDAKLVDGDARFILGDDAKLVSSTETHGHLLPLRRPVELPPNIIRLGRFSQWDSRATVDKVFAQAEALAESVTT